ncbi:MAG: flagellar export chaperone FlgN [Eubacterium sp.]|nr:flagellar export chaperone FlgN [Eubacterium sp.]
MTGPNEKLIYAGMMTDSLKKKKEILQKLLAHTEEQEALLSSEEMDVDRFEALLDEKGKGIDELNKIDDGFDNLFGKMEAEFKSDPGAYADDIKIMKKLIGDVTDLGTKIQVIEKKNNDRFKKYLTTERQKLRESNRSQQTAMTYLQNMNGYHKPGDSYFVNETK